MNELVEKTHGYFFLKCITELCSHMPAFFFTIKSSSSLALGYYDRTPVLCREWLGNTKQLPTVPISNMAAFGRTSPCVGITWLGIIVVMASLTAG